MPWGFARRRPRIFCACSASAPLFSSAFLGFPAPLGPRSGLGVSMEVAWPFGWALYNFDARRVHCKFLAGVRSVRARRCCWIHHRKSSCFLLRPEQSPKKQLRPGRSFCWMPPRHGENHGRRRFLRGGEGFLSPRRRFSYWLLQVEKVFGALQL